MKFNIYFLVVGLNNNLADSWKSRENFFWHYNVVDSLKNRENGFFGILCTCANRNLVTLKTPARFSFFEERKSQKERTARGRTAAFPKRKCNAWSSPFEPPLLSGWSRFFGLQREKQALIREMWCFSWTLSDGEIGKRSSKAVTALR